MADIACDNPEWGKTCIGPQGNVCGGAAPITEGCQGACVTCFRADLNFALPEPGKTLKRPTYFTGRFIDGLFVLSRARGFSRQLRTGDGLLEINGRKVTPALMRGIHRWTPAEVEIKAVKHRNNRIPEIVTIRAGRNLTKE